MILLLSILGNLSQTTGGDPTEPPPATLNNYYLDAVSGDDTAEGTQAAPWKTITRLNQALSTILPGTTIHFKGGQTFSGNVVFTRSGTVGNPIVFTSYGTGRAIINGGTAGGIKAVNCEYITVTNLEFTGSDSTRATSSTMWTNGGGAIEFRSTEETGAHFRGIEASYNVIKGYRVGVWVNCDADINGPQWTFRGYKGVTIRHNDISRCTMSGINFYNAHNFTITRNDVEYKFPDPGNDETAVQDVLIEWNKIYDCYGWTVMSVEDYPNLGQGSGMRISTCTNGIIQYNYCNNNGYMGNAVGSSASIELDSCHYVTVQYNEISNHQSPTTIDGAGIDVDGNCFNNIVQYNYLHGNAGGGFIHGSVMNGMYQTIPNSDNTFRFNILVNNGKVNGRQVQLWGQNENVKIYNNVFYSAAYGGGPVFDVQAPNTGYVANNILMTTLGNRLYNNETGSNLKLLNNLYYSTNGLFEVRQNGVMYNSLADFRAAGQETLNGTNYGINDNPLFVNPGTDPIMMPDAEAKTLTLYDLQAGSPAKGAGVDFSALIGSIGTKDFHDETIVTLNIGADAN